MISPWTIYQQKKQSSIDRRKVTKQKQEGFKHNKKIIKNIKNELVNQNQSHEQNQDIQQKQHKISNDNKEESQKFQIIQEKGRNSKSLLQNEFQNINKRVKNIQNQNNNQLINQQVIISSNNHHDNQLNNSHQQKSKQFLKNVISDQYDFIDNNKLLDFYTNQVNQHPRINKSPNRNRLIHHQKFIQLQKLLLIDNVNSIILLKYIKSNLSNQQQIEKQIQQNIQKVLQKLSPQFFSKISPQQQLLSRLLKNQLQKNHQIKQNIKQSLKQRQITKNKQKQIQMKYKQITKKSPKIQKYEKQINSSKNQFEKKKKNSKQNIMQILKQDIEKSSIIKYSNGNQSQYLQDLKPNKKQNIQQIEPHKSLQTAKSQILKVNNQKMKQKQKQKLISIGKKQVIDRHNQTQSLKTQIQNKKSQLLNPQQKNYESQIIQKDKNRKNTNNNGKHLIQQLMKHHIMSKQLKQNEKKSKTSQKLLMSPQIMYSNLKSNRIINAYKQQNISPIKKLKKNTLLSNHNVQQKHNKRNSTLNLSSPLLPPQFQLPHITQVHSQLKQVKLSSSSKLLQLLTSNIIASKGNTIRRNSNQNQKNNLLDQLFIKDKNKKQIRMRRNLSVNSKTNKRQLNQEQTDNAHDSIDNIPELKNKNQENFHLGKLQPFSFSNKKKKSASQQPINLVDKGFFSERDYQYNFTKRKNKLTPLETLLVSLLSPQDQQKQKILKQKQKQTLIAQMNCSHMKFSDHKLISQINKPIIN